MITLTVRYTWCDEHCENHMVDEHDECQGESLHAIEARGYTWARHIGGGWYRLQERYPQRLTLDSQLLANADARADAWATREAQLLTELGYT